MKDILYTKISPDPASYLSPCLAHFLSPAPYFSPAQYFSPAPVLYLFPAPAPSMA